MKWNTITGLFLAALILAMPGCTTTGGLNQNTADKIAPILAGSVAGAVVYAYTRNPQTEVYVGTIRAALYEFTLSTNLNPANLQAVLFNLPIPELKKPEAQLIMSPILATYAAFWDQTVKSGVDKNPGMKTLITAMISGLDQGLIGIANIKNPATPAKPTAAITDEQSLDIVVKALEQDMRARIQSGG